MNYKILIFIFFTIPDFLFCQTPILPPELYWWLAEVQKGNPNISLDSFKYNGIAHTELTNEKFDKAILYPVFMRWNYSASRVAYFNFGCALLKENGKYSIGWDIDSGILILDKNFNLLFSEPCGSDCGYDAVAWLRDDLLVAVGIIINNGKTIDLVINYYKIQKNDIELYGYEYRNAFNNDIRIELNLNWVDQRKDYFNE